MQLENKVVKWIKLKIKQSKANGLVVGLSGGVDSAVVAVLSKKAMCERAFRKKNMLCFILPCEIPSQEIADAKHIAKKFNLKTKIINLTPVYHQLLKILPRSNRITQGNLKARLRMLTLYYFANSYNLLVVGTGNKSELLTGYFTKYGDGGIDILPLGNFVKRDVRELAKKLGIPRKIIDKVPSAGLWQNQTDEQELGITYNELDDILEGKTKNTSSQKLVKIKKLIIKTEHKRRTPEIFQQSEAKASHYM